MARSLTAAVLSAIQSVTSKHVHLLKLGFYDSGTSTDKTQRIATAPLSSQVDVGDGAGLQTWDDFGGNVTMNPIPENSDFRAQQTAVNFPGLDRAVIANLLSWGYVNRPFGVWRAKMSGTSVISDPFPLFIGSMSGGAKIKELKKEGGTVRVELKVVSDLAILDQVTGVQTNVVSHEAALQELGLPAGTVDTFFDTIPGNARRIEPWGSRVVERGT